METQAMTNDAVKAPAPPADPPQDKVDTRADEIEKGKIVLVIDRTAKDPNQPRIHEIDVDGQIKSFAFKPGEPKELPRYVAAKFLRHDSFYRVNLDGDEIEWEGKVPKQPDEVVAGERFEIKPNETIARYDELKPMALAARAALLPGGDVKIREPGMTAEKLLQWVIQQKEVQANSSVVDEGSEDEDLFLPDTLNVDMEDVEIIGN